MRTPAERTVTQRMAREVLRLADRQSVQWRALCLDCSGESEEWPRRDRAALWQIAHCVATDGQHDVILSAVFQIRGGEGTFGVFSSGAPGGP